MRASNSSVGGGAGQFDTTRWTLVMAFAQDQKADRSSSGRAPIFHGRTRAIGTVLEALDAQARVQRPFVLVVGASGSGKSSLVRAGVLPLVSQAETIEGIGLWRWA